MNVVQKKLAGGGGVKDWREEVGRVTSGLLRDIASVDNFAGAAIIFCELL